MTQEINIIIAFNSNAAAYAAARHPSATVIKTMAETDIAELAPGTVVGGVLPANLAAAVCEATGQPFFALEVEFRPEDRGQNLTPEQMGERGAAFVPYRITIESGAPQGDVRRVTKHPATLLWLDSQGIVGDGNDRAHVKEAELSAEAGPGVSYVGVMPLGLAGVVCDKGADVFATSFTKPIPRGVNVTVDDLPGYGPALTHIRVSRA